MSGFCYAVARRSAYGHAGIAFAHAQTVDGGRVLDEDGTGHAAAHFCQVAKIGGVHARSVVMSSFHLIRHLHRGVEILHPGYRQHRHELLGPDEGMVVWHIAPEDADVVGKVQPDGLRYHRRVMPHEVAVYSRLLAGDAVVGDYYFRKLVHLRAGQLVGARVMAHRFQKARLARFRHNHFLLGYAQHIVVETAAGYYSFRALREKGGVVHDDGRIAGPGRYDLAGLARGHRHFHYGGAAGDYGHARAGMGQQLPRAFLRRGGDGGYKIWRPARADDGAIKEADNLLHAFLGGGMRREHHRIAARQYDDGIVYGRRHRVGGGRHRRHHAERRVFDEGEAPVSRVAARHQVFHTRRAHGADHVLLQLVLPAAKAGLGDSVLGQPLGVGRGDMAHGADDVAALFHAQVLKYDLRFFRRQHRLVHRGECAGLRGVGGIKPLSLRCKGAEFGIFFQTAYHLAYQLVQFVLAHRLAFVPGFAENGGTAFFYRIHNGENRAVHRRIFGLPGLSGRGA